MKKLLLLILLSSTAILSTDAQQNDAATKSKQKVIDGIRREKMRKPIPLTTSNQDVKKKESTEKKRAFDTKLSNVANSNEEGEAQICINPNNPNQLVVSYMDNTAAGAIEYPVYYSSNGGSSWTKSSFNTFNLLATEFPGYSFIGGGDPVFAWDKNNNLYFSWIYLTINQAFDTAIAAMHWAKSIDGGATFNLQNGNNRYVGLAYIDPFSPDFDVLPGSDGFYDRQWLAVDNSSGSHSGQLYCSFIYFNTPSEPISLMGGTIKRLNSGGTAFGNKIQASSGTVQFNNIRVDNTGTVHLTGADVDLNKVIYCKSTDGGNTFSPTTTIYTGTNLFGTQGSGFIHDRENSATNMEVDGANNVHVVWSDYSATPDSNFKSFYSKLNNGGSTFSTPLDLNTLFPAGLRVMMPVVSTSGNRITIGAYAINTATRTGDYYIINSDNNGQNWSAPIKLSTASTNFKSASNNGSWFGDYYNAVRTDNKIYNIWSDGRGTGKPKMYVSTYTAWPADVQDLSPVNSPLQLDDVYPVPASNTLTLNLRCNEKTKYAVQLISMDGKTVLSENHTANAGMSNLTIPVEQFASGQYMLQLITESGFRIARSIQLQKTN
ncbi:MAG: T9SS type A sorting domain-containing protein [Chitinophagaceae bacterium]|nr:T9SS type A sorting domain-containing protein [Chitinophagaceae bacterium]